MPSGMAVPFTGSGSGYPWRCQPPGNRRTSPRAWPGARARPPFPSPPSLLSRSVLWPRCAVMEDPVHPPAPDPVDGAALHPAPHTCLPGLRLAAFPRPQHRPGCVHTGASVLPECPAPRCFPSPSSPVRAERTLPRGALRF